ncbi:MAG: amidase domain-containing protein [Solirubrobacterales bacterium]
MNKCYITNFKTNILKLILLFLLFSLFKPAQVLAAQNISKEEAQRLIEQIFINRNRALLTEDTELIESIYNKDSKYGKWAFEYEVRKMKYIKNWAEKQGVKFTDIKPKLIVRKVKGDSTNISVSLLCSTEYKYMYENQSGIENTSTIGTYHNLQLINKEGEWIITKEWYKDPFGDSLNLENIKADSIKEYILGQNSRDLTNLSARRNASVSYAKEFCGAASEEQFGYKYNKKYRDYNPAGGDCANFASQILFEGGKFKKNSAWNYDRLGATGAWLNAGGFKSYMLNSGRASLIAYGSYDKVYKASFKLLPGDFIAYENKGDINHISVVTGADSKGYSLVTCHNSDRNNVPWDLGWSNKNIKFYLVRVNY